MVENDQPLFDLRLETTPMNRHPRTGRIAIRGVCMLFLVFSFMKPAATTAQNWSVIFDGVGTFSSPRVTDLNGDGVSDVILGAGREEFQACDSAIVALDGRNGQMLWKVKAIDQIFGSAALRDLNGDGIMDAVIGGRSAELKAIDGATGKLIWKFNKKKGAKKWYNF